VGIFINSKTNYVDPSTALGKFFLDASIMLCQYLVTIKAGTHYPYIRPYIRVVCTGLKVEMLAVHLVKSYCLPILLYGCEIWRCSLEQLF